jgi:hypothetical protein
VVRDASGADKIVMAADPGVWSSVLSFAGFMGRSLVAAVATIAAILFSLGPIVSHYVGYLAIDDRIRNAQPDHPALGDV